MPFMFVTFAVFQLPIGWLNAEALANINAMLLTFDVSQLETSPLNTAAWRNISSINVT